MTRKHADAEPAGISGRARHAASQAVPMARQAVPMTKNAGLATRRGAQCAVAWVTPHVNGARSWAAPRIERTGLAVRDSLAPRVSAVLVTTAHRLDATPRRSRRWPRLLAGTAMLAAVASAAMAMAMRRRPGPMTDAPISRPAAADGATAAAAAPPQRRSESDGSQADAELGEQYRI